MASVAKNLNAAFLSVGKTVKTSSGSAINIVICLATVGSEQLFSFAVFNCPCPPANGTESGRLGVVNGNVIYGSVFIIVPSVTLFFLGYAMNIRTWKLMTGCCKRDPLASRGYLAGCSTLLEIFMQSLVAPCAWISIAFLDGKYYACATTLKPYDMACSDVVKTPANKLPYTVDYERQIQTSQVIGWVFIATALIIGGFFYMCYRWISPLTYHQRHYMMWYQEIEKQQFEEVAKEEITKETKENVKSFLKHRREKEYWDKISTVFTHTRNKEGYEVYSRLDQWCEQNEGTSCVDDNDKKTRDLSSDASVSSLGKVDETTTNTVATEMETSKNDAETLQLLKSMRDTKF